MFRLPYRVSWVGKFRRSLERAQPLGQPLLVSEINGMRRNEGGFCVSRCTASVLRQGNSGFRFRSLYEQTFFQHWRHRETSDRACVPIFDMTHLWKKDADADCWVIDSLNEVIDTGMTRMRRWLIEYRAMCVIDLTNGALLMTHIWIGIFRFCFFDR